MKKLMKLVMLAFLGLPALAMASDCPPLECYPVGTGTPVLDESSESLAI